MHPSDTHPSKYKHKTNWADELCECSENLWFLLSDILHSFHFLKNCAEYKYKRNIVRLMLYSIYTHRRIIHQDERRKKVLLNRRIVLCSIYTHRRIIHQDERRKQVLWIDGSSWRMVRLLAHVYTQTYYQTNYFFLAQVHPSLV